MVRVKGLEPPRELPHENLNLACLPVSPHPQKTGISFPADARGLLLARPNAPGAASSPRTEYPCRSGACTPAKILLAVGGSVAWPTRRVNRQDHVFGCGGGVAPPDFQLMRLARRSFSMPASGSYHKVMVPARGLEPLRALGPLRIKLSASAVPPRWRWCRWQDLNLHRDEPRPILNRVRLPFHHIGIVGKLERVRGLEPRLRVWKTPVLAPTPYPHWSGRRDLHPRRRLGKPMLYCLSYARIGGP